MIKTTNSTRLPNYAAAFSAISLLVLFVMVIPIGRTHPDDYYLGRVFLDLFVDNGSWRDWVPPSAPSFFPDGVIYGAISLFTTDILKVWIIYAGVIGLVTSVVLFKLNREVGLDRRPALLTVMIVLLGFFYFGEHLTVWSRPSQHFLTYFNFVLCNLLLLRSMKRPSVLLYLVPLISVSVLSDFLFIPIFTASSFLVLLVFYLHKDIELYRGALIAGSILAALAAGVICYQLIVPNPQTNPVWASGVSIREAMTSLRPHMASLAHVGNQLFSIPLLLSLAALAFAYAANRGHDVRLANIRVVSTMLLSAILVNLYVVGLGSDWTISRPQYSILVLNGALTLFAISVGFIVQRRLVYLPYGFAAVGGIALAVATRHESPTERYNAYAQFLSEVNCVSNIVQSNGLSYGLASFQESDRFTVISNNQISLNTLIGNRMTTKHYVLSRGWSKRTFDYVLVQNDVDPAVYNKENAYYPLSEEIVKRALGEPSGKYSCPKFSVMVYNRKIVCLANDRGTHDCDRFGG